ncbi:MAG: hypothetical protein ACFCGT_09065 [Sandaracinaceae bacterium]
MGCGTGSSAPFLDPLPESPRFAVILSDYTSTAIAMLDEEAGIIDPQWIDSGSTAPGIVATLSGDVAVPSQQRGDGTLTVLDRLGTDVLTRVVVPTGALVGQVRTHSARASQSGYSSNPQDVVFGADGRAWVTRLEPNLAPDAPPLDAGSDLLAIEPDGVERGGQRIDLSAFEATETVVDDDGASVEVRTHPRPSRAVAVAGRWAVVGLLRLDLTFVAAASPGAVAVVDLDTGQLVARVDFPERRVCGQVSPVPGAGDRVLVACGGFFGEQDSWATTTGLSLLEVAVGGDPVPVASFRPADVQGAPLAVQNAVSLGGTLAVAVAYGSHAPGDGDQLYQVDLARGQARRIATSDEGFDLGLPAFDPSTGLLVVPDASRGLRLYRLRDGSLEEERVVTAGLFPPLPARSVHLLR